MGQTAPRSAVRGWSHLVCERITLVLGGWLGRANQAHRTAEMARVVVPVVQDDLEAFQEPPPKDWPPAFICQVPCMELLETEPE